MKTKKLFSEQDKDHVFSWASQLQMNITPSFEGKNPILLIPEKNNLKNIQVCRINDILQYEDGVFTVLKHPTPPTDRSWGLFGKPLVKP